MDKNNLEENGDSKWSISSNKTGFRPVSRQQQDRFRNKLYYHLSCRIICQLFCNLFCRIFCCLFAAFFAALFAAFLPTFLGLLFGTLL
jgi:hypothetical protein